LLIEPGVEITKNDKYYFSSQAGNAEFAEKHLNPNLGNYEDVANSSVSAETWNSNLTKIRGIFNSYIGTSKLIDTNKYYNIYQKDYDFTNKWREYFKLRYNDESPYLPVSDRIEWKNLLINDGLGLTPYCFRGDCYISTYTHRMN